MNKRQLIAAAVTLGIAPVPLTSLSIVAHADANQCLERDPRIMPMMNANKPPQSASVIVQLTNILYVVDVVIMVLDRDCQDEPGYDQVRSEYVNIRNQTMTTCQQMASSSSVCVPTPYARRY